MKTVQLAGCVILDSEGRFLLIHRNTRERTQWETPGGKIEGLESAAEAATREIKEELGVDIEILKLLGKKEFFEDEILFVYNWFLANIVKGQSPKVIETDKFDELRFFDWKEAALQREWLSPNASNLIDEYQRGNIEL